MNADERTLVAELNAAIDDDGEDGGRVDGLEAGPLTAATWGLLPGAATPGRVAARSSISRTKYPGSPQTGVGGLRRDRRVGEGCWQFT